MKEVGDKFGAGELILPFVLQSAETMKKTVSHLENYLEKVEGVTKGTVVIATVYGDVHDIGKNLVKTILANNGYTVIDLGKQVPAETIITKAVEANATAIGLSALLVSTSKQMPLIVNEMHRRGHKIPILIGGAAINRRFGRRILFAEDGNAYEPGVFYCKDAFEGLDTMDPLIDPNRKPAMLEQLRKDADMEMGRASQTAEHRKTDGNVQTLSLRRLPLPAKLGQRIVKDMPLEMVLKHLNINELYRLSWGAKNTHGKEWEKLKAEFDARLQKMTKEALKDGWLKPQAVYGYFPCQADGDELIIYDPDTINSGTPEELTRFTFRASLMTIILRCQIISPPSNQVKWMWSLFKLSRLVSKPPKDLKKCKPPTITPKPTSPMDSPSKPPKRQPIICTNTSAANWVLAKSRANVTHGAIPPSPNWKITSKSSSCLPAVESELGMSLSTSGQLIPEQSTAAIIVHHAQAKYYSVGESRVEQLMK